MKRSCKSSAEKIDEFILQKSKTFFVEVGMDNLDVEIIEQIQDHDHPSIQGSADEIISISDTEPARSADCVHQGNLNDANIISNVEPTKLEPSTSDKLNTNVGTSPTRLFKDTPNPDRTIDGCQPPRTERGEIIQGSNQHGNLNHTLVRLKN